MKKIMKRYVFNGLGFPIILRNVPMIKMRGEFVLDINYNELQKAVLTYLCHKQSPLTGNEIKFIRKYFELTLAAFGASLGFSHVTVLKWEKYGNRYAKIEPTTDVCIRLFIFSHLHSSGNAFKELYEQIDIPRLAKIQKSHQAAIKPLAIDVQEDYKLAS